MEITRLKLNQYRNYDALELRPAPGINVILGDNAQGKTNAAEAIFLCAFGRSHRTSRDAELIASGCAGGYVGVELISQSGARRIEFKLRAGERRQIFVDKLPIARSAELMGVLQVVMFSPEDLALIKGGPAERRRYLDMEISQQRPAYYAALQKYNAALRQRNALLKNGGGADMLSLWNEQLASWGGRIMRDRAAFLSALAPRCRALHAEMTGGAEDSLLAYAPNVKAPADADVYARTGAIFEALQAGADEDGRRGYTGAGPHRDDFTLLLNGADVRVYGSQGQQRTAAISLKLSEIDMLEAQTGESPVLILDDALSELDDGRGRLLLDALRRCQCFLTCTSLEGLKRAGLRDYTVWRCIKGHIAPDAPDVPEG